MSRARRRAGAVVHIAGVVMIAGVVGVLVGYAHMLAWIAEDGPRELVRSVLHPYPDGTAP